MLLEKAGIPYLSSTTMARHGTVVHAFLGRNGVSFLPLAESREREGAEQGDSAEDEMNSNYRRLAATFCLQVRGPVTAKQVHGNSVFVVEDKEAWGPNPVEADAIITNVPGVAVGVLTADCLPIVLFDPVKKVAGVVHAGWRGTVKQVARRAVESFSRWYGSRPGDMVAALGPSIGPCCYNVEKDVTDEFQKAFGKVPGYVTATGLNIEAANTDELLASGLKRENISNEGVCTCCRNELFFSYRKEGRKAGRQISFVMLLR